MTLGYVIYSTRFYTSYGPHGRYYRLADLLDDWLKRDRFVSFSWSGFLLFPTAYFSLFLAVSGLFLAVSGLF